jgi:ParB-like nuclease domain
MRDHTELIIEDLAPQHRLPVATREDLRSLADDIHTNGLRHPITVSGGVVLNGLKRVEAFKLLGRARIPAFVSEDYRELCEQLAESREGEKVDIARAMSLVSDLLPIRSRYITWRKRISAAKRAETTSLLGVRHLLASTIGHTGGATEALSAIMTRAAVDPEVAKRAQNIITGDETLYGMLRELRREGTLRKEGDRYTTAEQARAVVESGLRSLATTHGQLVRLGDLAQLTPQEREAFLAALELHRRAIAALGRDIRRGMGGNG